MKEVFSLLRTRDLGQNYVGHKQTLFQLVLSQSLEGDNSHSQAPSPPIMYLLETQRTEVARDAG